MWVNRREWDKVRADVDYLKSLVNALDEQLQKKQERQIPYGWYPFAGWSVPHLTVNEAIAMIFDHLGVTVERTEAQTKLVKVKK